MLKGKDRAAASGLRICLLLPVFGPRDTPSSSLPPPSNLLPSRNLRDHLPGHPPPLGPASAFLRLAPYRPPTLVPSSSEPSPGGASHPLLPAPAPTCSVPISTATTGLLRARAASPAGSLRSSTAPILWGERKASAQLRPLPACTGLGGGGERPRRTATWPGEPAPALHHLRPGLLGAVPPPDFRKHHVLRGEGTSRRRWGPPDSPAARGSRPSSVALEAPLRISLAPGPSAWASPCRPQVALKYLEPFPSHGPNGNHKAFCRKKKVGGKNKTSYSQHAAQVSLINIAPQGGCHKHCPLWDSLRLGLNFRVISSLWVLDGKKDKDTCLGH